MAEIRGSKRVAVTGGAGVLSSFVVAALGEPGCPAPFVPRSRECDLRKEPDTARMLEDTRTSGASSRRSPISATAPSS
jgi:hypothetical protein